MLKRQAAGKRSLSVSMRQRGLAGPSDRANTNQLATRERTAVKYLGGIMTNMPPLVQKVLQRLFLGSEAKTAHYCCCYAQDVR